MIVANVLMLVGGVVWLAGELFGVWRNHQAHAARRAAQTDTTSQVVWSIEARWPLARVVVGVFVLSLFAHLLFGTWLLP